jgi:calcium/calmodulin-dependent protein kinase I
MSFAARTALISQPEIFKKAGHGKPVDIWAIGVISYFLLCGYTPFDRDSQYEEMQAICNGDYKFEPVCPESLRPNFVPLR